jgi:hypothetical protein
MYLEYIEKGIVCQGKSNPGRGASEARATELLSVNRLATEHDGVIDVDPLTRTLRITPNICLKILRIYTKISIRIIHQYSRKEIS